MNQHKILDSILPGDTVFDIGSHLGEKAAWFLERGAKVICVEPQPQMMQALKVRYGENNDVELVEKALGAKVASLPMSICSQVPTISTLSDSWKKGRFAGYTWDSTVVVEVTTLDILVSQFGVPRYAKIDVEGFEKSVIGGLSSRVGVISFEFTSEYINSAFEIIGSLISLGYSKFNLSIGESPEFALPKWLPFFDLIPILIESCRKNGDLWGDIYAN